MSVGDMVLNFGKHPGKKVSEVPSDYLTWLSDVDRNPKGVIVGGVNWSEISDQYFQEQKRIRAAQPKPAKPSRFDNPNFRRQACEIEPLTVDGVTYTLMVNYCETESYWSFATRDESGAIVPVNVPNKLYGDQYKVIRSWLVDADKSVPDSFYH